MDWKLHCDGPFADESCLQPLLKECPTEGASWCPSWTKFEEVYTLACRSEIQAPTCTAQETGGSRMFLHLEAPQGPQASKTKHLQ